MSPAARQVLRLLALTGTWTDREALASQSGLSEFVLDQTLADLVEAGQVLYQRNTRHYRLAGTPLACAAARRLARDPSAQRALVARGSDGQGRPTRLGVAVRGRGPDGQELLAMAEIELGEQTLEQQLQLLHLLQAPGTPVPDFKPSKTRRVA